MAVAFRVENVGSISSREFLVVTPGLCSEEALMSVCPKFRYFDQVVLSDEVYSAIKSDLVKIIKMFADGHHPGYPLVTKKSRRGAKTKVR